MRQAIRSYKCTGKEEKQKGTQERKNGLPGNSVTGRQDPHSLTAEGNGTLPLWRVCHMGFWDGEASLLALTESGSSLENAITLAPHHLSYPCGQPSTLHALLRSLSPPYPLSHPPPHSELLHCFYCRPSRARHATRIRCQLDTHPIHIRPEQLHNWALAGAMRCFQESKQQTFPCFTLSPF